MYRTKSECRVRVISLWGLDGGIFSYTCTHVILFIIMKSSGESPRERTAVSVELRKFVRRLISLLHFLFSRLDTRTDFLKGQK